MTGFATASARRSRPVVVAPGTVAGRTPRPGGDRMTDLAATVARRSRLAVAAGVRRAVVVGAGAGRPVAPSVAGGRVGEVAR